MPDQIWLPGSFTKNFSWGQGQGLRQLYENIRIGFAGKLQAVPRDIYRERVASAGRPDFIPINFFLFNTIRDGISQLIVDELVFQALTAAHSPRFDKLALFAFNFSYVGRWNGATAEQRHPANWARQYVVQRVAQDYRWDTDRISASDVEQFLRNSPQYRAATYTKVSTNLNYLYKIGDLKGFRASRIERWWVDALFLALDRLLADREIDKSPASPDMLPRLLLGSKFIELTGPSTPEKTFAMAHLLSLHSICDGVKRFDHEWIKERTAVLIPDYHWQEPNDERPQGAMHPTNPRILKTIPRDCASLAALAGFQIVYADDVESFDPDDFVARRATEAVENLQRIGIEPAMTAEDLHKLTRGE